MATKKTTNTGLRVTAIRIKNILGIEDMNIKPGSVTLIEGRNGSGKSSILEAIKSGLTGGHDATLLRHGADKGEVVLILNNDHEIKKTVKQDDSKTTVTNQDMVPVPKPGAWINNLRDAFALNPIDFLFAKPAERIQTLLAAMPIRLEPTDLDDVKALVSMHVPEDQHALRVLDAWEKDIFDQRTGVNRVAKEKRATLEQMSKGLPPWTGEAEDILAKIDNARKERDALQTSYNEQRDAIKEEGAGLVKEVTDAANAEIEKLRKDLAEAERKIAASASAKVEQLRRSTQGDVDSITENHNERITKMAEDIATMEAQASEARRAKDAKEAAATMKAEAEKFEKKSAAFTDALDAIKTKRTELLSYVPIKGVTVKDNELLVDDVVFDRTNEANRIRVAMGVAMLRAGGLPMVCIDGAERLDANSLELLQDSAEAAGIQLVMARVTDGGLTISTPVE